MRTLIIIATIAIIVIALCALQGCGTVGGLKMRIEKEIDQIYCMTVMEARFGTMMMSPDYVIGGGWIIGITILIDVPITATTDTLMLPWDVYILTHPVKGE